MEMSKADGALWFRSMPHVWRGDTHEWLKANITDNEIGSPKKIIGTIYKMRRYLDVGVIRLARSMLL